MHTNGTHLLNCVGGFIDGHDKLAMLQSNVVELLILKEVADMLAFENALK